MQEKEEGLWLQLGAKLKGSDLNLWEREKFRAPTAPVKTA